MYMVFRTSLLKLKYKPTQLKITKVNNSGELSTFTMLCNHYLNLVPKHFHHSKIKLHICQAILLHSLLSAPGNYQSAFCFHGFIYF
jgi:hypothetical protein